VTTANDAVLQLDARRTVLRQTLVPGWAALACILVAEHAPVGIRAPVVIVFLCVVPGAALVGLLNPASFAVELSLSIALSVALSGLTAGVLVYAHLWSPTAVILIVAAISFAGGLRDVRLGHRLRHVTPRLVRNTAPLRRRVSAPRLSPGAAAIPPDRRLAARSANGVVAMAAARPEPAARHAPASHGYGSRPEQAAVPPVAASPLQGFLLDELGRSTGSHGSRRRRPPRSLPQFEPHELADLLSWPSLQRFVTQRAIREVNPELWFVDDLERRLRLQRFISRGERPGRAPLPPRGVLITGALARTSIPVAWRVLEDDGKPKEWRTRLVFQMIDALPELGGAVVAASTAYGSLSGFRRGLEARCLPYLLRVDSATAACELAPKRTTRSSAEAREVLREWLDDAAASPAGAHPNGSPEEPALVVVQGAEHLLLCEVPVSERASGLWVSNLPAETAPKRLASLVRLANRSRVERATPDRLIAALELYAEGGARQDRELALVALARSLRTLDPSTAPAKGAVEA